MAEQHGSSAVTGAVAVPVPDDDHGEWEVEDLAFLDSVIQDPTQLPLGEVLTSSLLDVSMAQVEASMTAAATDSSALAPEAGTGDLVVRIRLPAATATRPRAKTDTTSCPSSSIATARSTHRRQKEEMTYLRERVKELEAELRVLRAANNGEDRTAMSPLDSPSVEDDGSPDENASAQLAKYVATHVKTTPTDLWEMVATHQMEEKQKAEAENTRLRAMLEEQIRIAKSLEKIFRKRPSTATIEAYDTGLKRARQYKDDPSAIYDELVQNLDARLHHLERVFDLNGLSKMKFDFMYAQARSDDERCVYVEYLDSKTVPFSRNDTQHAIWKCLSMERLALPNGHYACTDAVDDLIMGQFICRLRRRKTYADIDAKFVCKQFVEEHRTVMVWESLTDSEGSIYYNTDGVQLREKGWTLIESIDDAKTVVQSAVRFIPEVDVNNARDKYKVGVLSDLMVSSYRANMATLYRAVENELMKRLIESSPRI